MPEKSEPAQRRGNATGPVMGGINLAMYPVEFIPLETRLRDEAQRLVERRAKEREGSSTERHAEQASQGR